jgi:hypothetical protein
LGDTADWPLSIIYPLDGGFTYNDESFEEFAYYLPSTDPNDLPQTSNVPEPSTFLLLGAGLLGMIGIRTRKDRR